MYIYFLKKQTKILLISKPKPSKPKKEIKYETPCFSSCKQTTNQQTNKKCNYAY